jgi:hypothetical protein
LLYAAGYEVGRYISLERIIEGTRITNSALSQGKVNQLLALINVDSAGLGCNACALQLVGPVGQGFVSGDYGFSTTLLGAIIWAQDDRPVVAQIALTINMGKLWFHLYEKVRGEE